MTLCVKTIAPSEQSKKLFVESFKWGYRNISASSLGLPDSTLSDDERKNKYLNLCYEKEVQLNNIKKSQWIGVEENKLLIAVVIVEPETAYARQMFSRRGGFLKNQQLIKDFLN